MEMPGIIIKDPEILGGEPVFRGTRVPFKILIEYLEGGYTLDQFLEQYPASAANSPSPPSKKQGLASFPSSNENDCSPEADGPGQSTFSGIYGAGDGKKLRGLPIVARLKLVSL